MPASLKTTLRETALRYPPQVRQVQVQDVERIAFHVKIVSDRVGPDATVCDLGGGVGMFSIGCAAVGMRVLLVDDFADPVNREGGDAALDIHRSWGVEILHRDVITQPLELPVGTLDAVTAFDTMEHWHHSPKQLFHACCDALRAGGLFVLATPNCANLRKRVQMPFGKVQWSSMDDWYESVTFRGHVREPAVDDLRYIADDLGLVDVELLGRNWSGYRGAAAVRRCATLVCDRVLQRFPTLCSDIYLIGRVSTS